MKQLITKAAIVVLAVFLSLPMMAVEVEIDGINYDLIPKGKAATVIFKNSGKYSGDIIIPRSVEHEGVNYSVTSIGDRAFYRCYGLSSVTIPNSVTSIGDDAFQDCSGLPSITIPNSVTSIGDGAFASCNGLTSVTIPISVTNIEGQAFRDCFGLTSVHISDLAAWCDIEFASFYANPLFYAHHLYLNGEEVKDLVIPNSMTYIAGHTFAGCSGLTSVTIPNSVKNICWYAFMDCSGLTSVTIPNSVTSIDHAAFSGCSGLTSVTIPNSVTSIWNYAFSGCSGLTSVTIPYGVTSIREYAFSGCSGLTSVTIPNSVTSIEYAAFQDCSGLPSITIPNSVTSIGEYAFLDCSGLTSVAIPNSVTSIGHVAFAGCSGLTSVTIPNSVTSIGSDAFSGCSGLTSVTIGSGVRTICSDAFQNCPELLDVYCYAEEVPFTTVDGFDGSHIFEGSDIEYANLYVPATSIESYKATAPWKKFGKIIGLPGGESEESGEKVLVDGEEYENVIDRDFEAITYTRTLNNSEWNALYLPFEIPVSQLLDKYEVAYINTIHSYDDDENGEIDRMSMEIIKLKNGTLHANHPYLIKARTEEAKQMNITVENTTLYKAESKTLDCSSIYTKFEITGTYEKMTSEQLDGWYALSDGTWKHLSPNSDLDPFRLYLRITSREGSPVKVSTASMARIGIHVKGEETVTSIEELLMQRDPKTEVVYDLNGRCITNPQKGQIYVVNGKKRMY